MIERPATYLGDGAYIEFTGYSFVLYTDNGLQRTNEVHIEPSAVKKLEDFLELYMRPRP